MFKAGFNRGIDALHTASARCGLDTINNWWRGSWWRSTPPAVPYAPVFDADSR